MMTYEANRIYNEIASYEAMRSLAEELHFDGWTVEECKEEHDLPAEWMDKIQADGSELDEEQAEELTMYANYMYRRLQELIDTKVINSYKEVIDYDTAVCMMDNDLREAIAAIGDHDGDKQGFFDAYAAAHLEKYGEPWELDKPHPVY